MMADQDKDTAADTMNVREITLADGRYMIFYTFEDSIEGGMPATDEQGEDVRTTI